MSRNQSDHSAVPFLYRFIATGFFSGYSPLFPGTAGSLVGLAIYAVPGAEKIYLLTGLIILIFLVGVLTSGRMEKHYGEDPQIVVVDEIAGMLISLYFIPKSLWSASAAFLFFRFFDIVKPPPARYMEKLKNGWGVMLDDVVAGIYANISLWILIVLVPGIGK